MAHGKNDNAHTYVNRDTCGTDIWRKIRIVVKLQHNKYVYLYVYISHCIRDVPTSSRSFCKISGIYSSITVGLSCIWFWLLFFVPRSKRELEVKKIYEIVDYTGDRDWRKSDKPLSKQPRESTKEKRRQIWRISWNVSFDKGSDAQKCPTNIT